MMPVSRYLCIFINVGLGEARYVIQRGANANGAWIRWSDGAIEVFGAGGSNDNGLAKVYPTLNLPDLRGEFIRGWDDSRGIDTGRSLLSSQAATFIRTALQDYYGYDLNTNVKVGIAFATADSVITVGNPANPKAGNNSDYVPASSDNSITGSQRTAEDYFTGAWISMRPRNLSFNYIVRAA
ncbi:phage tail protein [Escherichia albertii]|uniref:phage tail protein n=1 Tax=Escherichia albertii TaxID=208962 RepID=UPI001FC9D48A|nr:phage tail protein [Escherichia albertii]